MVTDLLMFFQNGPAQACVPDTLRASRMPPEAGNAAMAFTICAQKSDPEKFSTLTIEVGTLSARKATGHARINPKMTGKILFILVQGIQGKSGASVEI